MSLNFFSYAHRIGVDNIDLIRDSYFNEFPLTPFFKYFIDAGVCLLASITYTFRLKLRLLGLLFLALTVWLVIFPLQLYYGILAFNDMVVIGICLELVALSLYGLLIFTLCRGVPSAPPR